MLIIPKILRKQAFSSLRHIFFFLQESVVSKAAQNIRVFFHILEVFLIFAHQSLHQVYLSENRNPPSDTLLIQSFNSNRPARSSTVRSGVAKGRASPPELKILF